MAKITVTAELCKGCEICTTQCPKKIIVIGDVTNSKGYKIAKQINEENCTGCKLCAIVCPDAAIEVYK
ncbi:MAG: 4Fe-4S binding protein [Eubacteriaceae bacterium]|nr:4Fe-4S binding protein [Eubacteriaceae bacterium]